MDAKPMDSRRDLAIALGLATACVLLWSPLWTGENTFFAQDVAAYFFPMKALLADAVRAGEWPWWNPWIRNGLPFFANPQVGLFYPPAWLFFLLPLVLAFNWVVILHFIILATGIYAWLRREERSVSAALFGAAAVVTGGYAISMTTYLNNLQAMAWIGWSLWAWRGWLEERSARWVAVLAGTFALQFLAGEPQIPVVAALLALGWGWTLPFGADVPSTGVRRWGVPVVVLTGAGLAAMAVSAIQLVSTAELFALSARSQGLPMSEILAWSLEPLQTVNLVLPRYFDGPEGLFDFRRVPMATHPWVFTSYLGVTVVVLAACAPFRRAPAATGYWVGVSLIGLALALGEHNPLVAGLVESIPGAGLFRYPEKMLILPSVGVPVLATMGLDALAVGRRRGIVVGVGFAVLAGIAAVAVDLNAVEALIEGWPERIARHRDPLWILDGLRRGFFHVAVFSLLASTLLAIAARLRANLVAVGFLALVVVDLALVNLDAAPLAPSELYHRRPEVLEPVPLDHLQTKYRLRTTPLGEEAGEWFTVPGVTLATQQLFLFRTMGPNLSMLHRVLAEDGAEAFRPRRDDARSEILGALPPPMQVRLLRLTSTAYLYERPIQLEGLQRLPGDSILDLHPYRIVGPLPRAYLVQRAIVEPDSLAILNRFVAGGEDPGRIAYLAKGPGLDGPPEPVEGTVRWITSGNHIVELEVETPVAALLTLTDSYYPGWSVEVNGREADLERVNWFFRGVRLDAGSHRVRFFYGPRWIGLSATASIIALVGLCLVIVRGGSRGA